MEAELGPRPMDASREGKWGRNDDRSEAPGRKPAASSPGLDSYSLGLTIPPELEQVGGPARVHWADGHHPCPPSFSSWVLSPDSEGLRADHGQRSGIFLGFTGSAPAACLDAMCTRQPLTMADSEGTLPRIITTFQECPGSASFIHLPACSTARQNRLHFLQQDPTGLPRCSLVLGGLCLGQHVGIAGPPTLTPMLL